MEKCRAKQVIQAAIDSTNTGDLCELVYQLVVEEELDRKAIRNKVIKSEFNELYKVEVPVMDIYGLLSTTHNLSENAIRYIIGS